MNQQVNTKLTPDQILELLENELSEMATYYAIEADKYRNQNFYSAFAFRDGANQALQQVVLFARALHDGTMPVYRYRCGNCRKVIVPLTTNDALNTGCDDCADSPVHLSKERIA